MSRAWAIVAVGAAAAGAVYLLNYAGVIPFSSTDGGTVSASIQRALDDRLGTDQFVVTCPTSIPEQRGHIDDCQAVRQDTGARSGVRVRQDDSRGHYTWTLEDPVAVARGRVSASDFADSCVAGGAEGSQCRCIFAALTSRGTAADVMRAADSLRVGHGMPDDLSPLVASCRTGA